MSIILENINGPSFSCHSIDRLMNLSRPQMCGGCEVAANYKISSQYVRSESVATLSFGHWVASKNLVEFLTF